MTFRFRISVCILWASLGFGPVLLAQETDAPPPQDALRSIESTRGGRHWMDQPTPPPLSPADSQNRFQIEAGLRIELVAAEPLVMDPVAIAFDQRGRMFVAEYSDYPVGPSNPSDPPLSRIVMLIDEDGDGQMDRRQVFADRLDFCHSLMPFRGGILACTQHEIVFLEDTDGDQVADDRKTLFAGFTPAHPQMQIGNPRWGLDNWIYFNYGPGNIRKSSSLSPKAEPIAEQPISMPRQEFRFHPVTEAFGPASGLGQFGNTIDNFGRRFFSTNRNPIMTAPIPDETLKRNPYMIPPRDHYDVAPSGGASRVFPLVEMKSNYLSHAGTHTAACGTTAYRGDLLGEKFADSVFVCEPIGHLVTRSLIRQSGATLIAERAQPHSDFLASTDTWFRPVSLATGPNGALYVADMYRLWVEHPKFMPPDIAQRMDWRAGDDCGRIWRIVPVSIDSQPSAFCPPETDDELVKMLADPNGWRRTLAQRLIVESQNQSVLPMLREMLRSHRSEFARLHALWTLSGIDGLTVADLLIALKDTSPLVRKDAVSLSAAELDRNETVFEMVAGLVDDEESPIRFQIALALGESSNPASVELLSRIAVRDGTEPWFEAAILTAASDRSASVAANLLHQPNLSFRHRPLVKELAETVGARGDLSELGQLLQLIQQLSIGPDSTDSGEADWRSITLLTGLAKGLARHRGGLGKTSLGKLLADPPAAIVHELDGARKLIQLSAAVAVDKRRSLESRLAAIELAQHGNQEIQNLLPTLLAFDQPAEIQSAVLDAIGSNANPAVIKLIIERWPVLGPRVRPTALSILLRRNDATLQTLEAIRAGTILASAIDIDRRVLLLRHQDPAIKALSEQLFGGAISADRREVANRYLPALNLTGSKEAGKQVFENSCSKCHRLNGQGQSVGPDISDVRNRSPEALLYEILDPNQKIEPQYTAYLVQTTDGRFFSGLMINESSTAIVLRLADGKDELIPRDEIEQIQASGKSLMPEGVEKEISVQQMADLLEYIRS